MKVLLLPRAQKQLKKLNEPIKSRIVAAIRKLEESPPKGDIRRLEGRDGFRVRVGDYRLLCDTDSDTILVTAIEPRGGVYKR
ncbi:MAG: type II toxin-antitoxin system RelE/ParE family toxin [Clostridiales Family XIII bacterium]|jgi:mRNA interferase RelE/StbE|nr:type II toxin-antitoxin system RelE/ParE family toxin [Clostridiales Family XIII bacterium]